MAWLLAVAFLLTALIIVTAIAGKFWWFPTAISELARDYDDQFMLTLILTGFFFVLAHLVLAYIVVRFREGQGTASYWLGNIKWVWGTVIVMALLDLGLAFGSEGLWQRIHLTDSPEEALRIEVVGQQFVWAVRYAGPDGRFGRIRRELVDDAINPLGIDPDDPAGKDDLVQPTLLVPVGRPIELLLESKDVIHSFFVRELRIKQDSVPGMTIPLRFTADTVGRYEVACAELCGLAHHQMRTFLDVVEKDEFEARLQP
jgi:cytochrome c oxidase subunit 2